MQERRSNIAARESPVKSITFVWSRYKECLRQGKYGTRLTNVATADNSLEAYLQSHRSSLGP